MGSIKWQTPDGFAYTGTSVDADEQLADELRSSGAVPEGWEAVQFNVSIPEPAEQLTAAQIGAAVDALMDALARSWRYRDATRLLAARGSSNPQYAAEAQAFEEYWSQCWTLLDVLEDEVRRGLKPMPGSVEEVIQLLPPQPSRPGS